MPICRGAAIDRTQRLDSRRHLRGQVLLLHSFFCPLFRFQYKSRELQIDVEPNVSWEPPRITRITGRGTNEAA